MSRPFNESTAVIVGGSSGIGFAAAKALLAAGLHKLTISGRDVTRGRNALSKLAAAYPGAYLHFVQCDATDPDRTQNALQHAATAMGRIDILISCGGGRAMPQLLHTMPVDEFMPTLNELVAGIVQPAHAVLPIMTQQHGGTIVCVASDAAKIATPGECALGAGMAAVVMFCRTMAMEVKRHGVRINCACPSIVQGTPLYDLLMADEFSGRLFRKAEDKALLGNVEACDVADLICYLASPASGKITGQSVSVNGGISAI